MNALLIVFTVGSAAVFAFWETRRRHILAGPFSTLCVVLAPVTLAALTWRMALESGWRVLLMLAGAWVVMRLVYWGVPLSPFDKDGNPDFEKVAALRLVQPATGVLFLAASIAAWFL